MLDVVHMGSHVSEGAWSARCASEEGCDYRNLGLSTRDIFRKHGITQLQDLVEYESVLLVLIWIGVNLQTWNFTATRRRPHLQVPFSRTNYNHNSLLHQEVNTYNSQPGPIREIPIWSHSRSHWNRIYSSVSFLIDDVWLLHLLQWWSATGWRTCTGPGLCLF